MCSDLSRSLQRRKLLPTQTPSNVGIYYDSSLSTLPQTPNRTAACKINLSSDTLDHDKNITI
jgi:hypothetical protein